MEARTASGIYLPGTEKEKLMQAKVIATGPGYVNNNGDLIPTSVKQGEEVLIPGFGGQNIKVGDEEYLLFRDSEILAKVSKE